MDKVLVGIREASKIIGVSIETMRAWDREGMLVPNLRSGNGSRWYRVDDLRNFGKKSSRNEPTEEKT